MSDPDDFQPVTREEVCSLAVARRVAAMLDLSNEGLTDGQPLPIGWHFVLLGADTRRSELRSDGFPGLGVPMPDLGLPRLLIGGRSVRFLRPVVIGDAIRRVSAVKSIQRKSTPTGEMALVSLEHELFTPGQASPAIIESQTFVLLPAGKAPQGQASAAPAIDGLRSRTLVPDETLLFQYSALGFNSHKIHIDKAHARDVEGFPDLVVNGGLTTLLLTEFARNELRLELGGYRMKNLAPLYCNRPLTLAADREGEQWILKAYDDAGTLAARMEASLA